MTNWNPFTMDATISDFVHKLGQCSDVEQSNDLMADELSNLGFEQFVYAQILKNADGSVAEVMPTGTLDPEWLNLYFANGFDENDYACDHCIQSNAPLDWLHMFNTVNNNSQLKKFRKTSGAVQDFGFKNGVSLSIIRMKRRSSLISIISPAEVNNQDHKANYRNKHGVLLQLTEAFDAQMDVLSMVAKHYDLSRREIEMLKWLSDGFTPKSIENKTKTSVNTINKQILSAKTRLGCSTTIQAVSKALILGII